jgi:hypothetical protein
MSFYKNFTFKSLLIILIVGLTGCANIGKPFQFKGPKSIILGKTSKKEIEKDYGDPFRVGYENGKEKWTYGQYQYKVFGDSTTRDLAITFDQNDLVTDYVYSSSEAEEVKKFAK